MRFLCIILQKTMLFKWQTEQKGRQRIHKSVIYRASEVGAGKRSRTYVRSGDDYCNKDEISQLCEVMWDIILERKKKFKIFRQCFSYFTHKYKQATD